MADVTVQIKNWDAQSIGVDTCGLWDTGGLKPHTWSTGLGIRVVSGRVS